MNSKTIHVSLAGGLGNQLFQIAAALSMTEGKVVIHDLLGNARRDSNDLLEVENFDLPSRIEFASHIQMSKFGTRLLNLMYKTSVRPGDALTRVFNLAPLNAFKSFYFSKVIGMPLRVIQAQDNGFFKMKEIKKTSLIVGYFQASYWPANSSSKYELDQIGLLDHKKDKALVERSSKKVLALHIRLGDYVMEPNIGMLSEQYFISAIEYVGLVKSIDEIWLFSDEPDKAVTYVPQKLKSILKVIPEMAAANTLELMREADYFIISNSTFSWWGAFLSKSKGAFVVAPSPWFKSMKSPKGIIPNNWIKHESSFK